MSRILYKLFAVAVSISMIVALPALAQPVSSPASASFLSDKTNQAALSAPVSDEGALPPTEKMIAKREAAIAACENDPDPEQCVAEAGGGEQEGDPLLRDEWFYDRRTAGDPSAHFTMADAATLRAQAAEQAATLMAQQANAPVKPNAFGGAWTAVGPNPMVLTGRGDATFDAMTGRIGALAVASTSPYTIYLGGAQGGVWVSPWVTQTTSNQWTAKTDQASSLAIGAIALAPSNESIVYVGTGEGALSGDSYFGNGVLKSTDAGGTFFKVSAAGYFTNVSISKIVVDNTNPNTLYAGTLRGRGGARRTSPPDAAPFGVWKSTDGGVNWTLVYAANTDPLALAGVTDLAMDPQNSQIIYASVLGDAIYKTTNGGTTWNPVMNGLPAGADYASSPTRFALGIAHPSAAVSATLYTGFEYYNASSQYVHSTVWKSTNEGGSWSKTNSGVDGYCNQTPTSSATQCFYDNVIAVDPTNANIVFVIGLYNYNTGSGGNYRSMDGGASWVDIGFNMHPDYHAIAIRKDDPANIVVGNDGGVWLSSSRGGRPNGNSDPLNATSWVNLNGAVTNQSSLSVIRTGLQLGQFESVATNPAVANRFYGGFQDNGTQRKATGSSTWYDVASGDGGQVLIDPTDANYMYQTYYGLSAYRYVDGGGLYGGGYTSNESIRNNIPSSDRVEFYLPWIIDPGNSNRLYLGTYRVWRTDNAKTAKAGDVYWNSISGDLTSGCTGSASNGGRGCTISALDAPAEFPAVYAGTEEGWLWLSKNATAASPTWSRIDISGTTPLRPVAAIAADRSDYRVAVVGFNGFSAATPSTPGHVFMTANAGATWTRIDQPASGLPDVPVNTVVLDPSNRNTIYVGTDVGPFVTYNSGANWSALGSGFPIVSIQQMALNPYTRQLLAGTHGRGAWALTNSSTLLPALQIGKTDDGRPAGPGGPLTYQITVKNYGNITATNVVITDPVPANTTFVAAGPGGTFDGTNVVFTLANVAMPTVVHTDPSSWPTNTLPIGLQPGEATVTFTVQITNSLQTGDVVTNDGYYLTSAEGVGATGSPSYKTMASPYSFSVSPNYQWDGTNSGQVITYLLSIKNLGYNTDYYNLGVSDSSAGFNTTLWNSTFTALKSTTDPVAAGDSALVGVRVIINPLVANGVANTSYVVASSANSANWNSAQIKTIAVTDKILLVDDDGNGPNVDSYYQNALNAYGLPYNIADLASVPQLPQNYLKAHKVVVWYAGATYPGNLSSYDTNLAAFLDNGGRVFMSGWDLLDQSAGTTDFVYNYLHINWDGSETQNDKGTGSATAVSSNSIMNGLGVLPYTNFVSIGLGSADYSDQLTPVAPAQAAFTDSGTGQTDGLTVQDTTLGSSYKVVFLAFPFEAINTTSSQNALMKRTLDWFFQATSPASVTINGPTSGVVGTAYSFTAQVIPDATIQPITYTWQATGQSNVVHTGGGISDTATFNWAVGGMKTITVTASNAYGSAMNTAQVFIGDPNYGVISILHTNDFHGQLEASGSNPGYARDVAVFNQVRNQVNPANVLLLDAGDEMQGSLLSNLNKGAPVIDLFNLAGVKAATFGNHEFDWGQPNLISRTQQANYPFVTANIVVSDTSNCSTAGWTTPSFAKPWITTTVGTPGNQVVVGIVGVTTLETPQITIASATQGLCFKDPAASISHYIPAMKAAGAQVIVVLSHLGYTDGGYGYGIPVYGDQTLARNLFTLGTPANLIIGGHTHTNLAAATIVTSTSIPTVTTSIVQAYYNGRNVGRADLLVNKTSGAVTINWQRIVVSTSGPEDPAAKARIAVWASDPTYQALINQPIGYTKVDLPRNTKADNMMGTFVDDAIYSYLNTDGNPANDIDVFFNNAGGIRTDWCRIPDPANPGQYKWSSTVTDCHTGVYTDTPMLLTYGNMFTILPFGNATAVGTMTGAQIMDVVNFAPQVSNGVIQPAGLKYTYYSYTDTNPGPQPYAWGAYNITVKNRSTGLYEPLVMTKTYSVGTNEFLAPAGGDGYSGFKYMTNITYWGDMLNAVNAWVTANYTITTPYKGPNNDGTGDSRIVRNGTDTYGGTATEVVPVTILHHNDSHGDLLDYLSKGVLQPGYTRLATLIKQERLHNADRTLLLEGGDQIQGDAMMAFYKAAFTGKGADGTTLPVTLTVHPMMAVMNSMGYDAMTLGNHEFNFGSAIFKGTLGQATFPLLQANVYDKPLPYLVYLPIIRRDGTGALLSNGTTTAAVTAHPGTYGLNQVGVRPYITKTLPGPVGSINVAVLGIGNHRVPQYELPSNIPGLTFTNPITEAQNRAPALKAANDVVVALDHIGFTTIPNSVEVDANVDTNLAAQTTGIDAIVGAHSHTDPLTPDAPYKFLPTYVGAPDNTPVIINQAKAYNAFLGEMVLGLLPKAGGGYTVVARAGRDIPVCTGLGTPILSSGSCGSATPEDAATKAIIQPYDTFLATYKNRVVGQTTVPVDATSAYITETNAANLQADASLWKLNSTLPFHVDFHLSGAMTNGKIASTATPAVPYTMTINDMFTLMPYENSLVVLRLTGAQLKTLLERGYRNYWYYKNGGATHGGYSYYTTCMLDISAGGIITYTNNDPLVYTTTVSHVGGLSFGNTVVDLNDNVISYTVSTVNYLAAGSCNFNNPGVTTIWPLNQIVADTQNYVRDVVIQYIPTLAQPITPLVENRLRGIP